LGQETNFRRFKKVGLFTIIITLGGLFITLIIFQASFTGVNISLILRPLRYSGISIYHISARGNTLGPFSLYSNIYPRGKLLKPGGSLIQKLGKGSFFGGVFKVKQSPFRKEIFFDNYPLR